MGGPTQPSRDLRAQILGLERLGYDRARLLAAAGIGAAELDDPDARFPYDVAGRVLREARAQRPLSHIGLRIAAHVPFGSYDLIDYLVFSSETVAEGLASMARYFDTVTQAVTLHLEAAGDAVRFEVREACGDARAHRFACEYTVGITARRVREGTRGRCTVLHASFLHPGDSGPELETLLGFPIFFDDAWSGFAISRADAELPFERRDPLLHRLLEDHARHLGTRIPAVGAFADDVRRVIAEVFAHGDAPIAAVARRLGASPRTLQRRLREEGTSYQRLLDEMRCEAARRHLSDSSLAIADVAYLLGYSEPSAFVRAFRRWTGRSPAAARRQARRSLR
jgi:AraC-like DNA-binding protein